MAAPPPGSSITEKPDVEHVETSQFEGDKLPAAHDDDGLLKSRYSELSIPRTAWVFKRVILFVLLVYTGYVCEGFEVSSYLTLVNIGDAFADCTQLNAGGTIIANAGFIKQFGEGGSGVTALDPTWGESLNRYCQPSCVLTKPVSTWSAMLVS